LSAEASASAGIEFEFLAQPQQPGLRPSVEGRLVPFRPTDRAENNRVGGVRLFHGGVGDRDLMCIVAAAADQTLLGLECAHLMRIHPRDEFLDLGHDLGANAIAWKKKELVSRHSLPRSCIRCRVDC
jgi:hypothetical protein